MPQLRPAILSEFCNKLTSFYWMPSDRWDGRFLPLLPFGCIYKEWFRYHDEKPNTAFSKFFAHLIRVHPTGPTTIQGIVEAQKFSL